MLPLDPSRACDVSRVLVRAAGRLRAGGRISLGGTEAVCKEASSLCPLFETARDVCVCPILLCAHAPCKKKLNDDVSEGGRSTR